MKRPIFECDGCGDRHGHRTEMHDLDVVYPSGEYSEPTTETLHVCLECGPEGLHRLLAHTEAAHLVRAAYYDQVEDDSLRWLIRRLVAEDGTQYPRSHSEHLTEIEYLEQEVVA